MRWTYLNQNFPSNYDPSLVIRILQNQMCKFKNQTRNVLLYGYPSADANLARKPEETFFPRVVDEIYAISTHFGPIRSLFTIDSKSYSQEERQYNDPIQEKIVVEQVVKKVEREEGEEEQPEQEQEEETKEVKFNPNDYDWTLSDGRSKDILKVYSKLSKNLTEQVITDSSE